jgi:histidine triad (HIT) family protein
MLHNRRWARDQSDIGAGPLKPVDMALGVRLPRVSSAPGLWSSSMTSENYECNFCAIARRESPAEMVYEDDLTVAFAARAPVTKGHTLLIPRAHIANLFEVSDDLAAAIGFATKANAVVLSQRYQMTGLNVLHASGSDAQQSVFHFHHHLVPRRAQDGLDMWLRVIDR